LKPINYYYNYVVNQQNYSIEEINEKINELKEQNRVTTDP